MKRCFLLYLAAGMALLWCSFGCSGAKEPPRVLIFSKTTGYRHESIPAGARALYQLCRQHGILADTTEDAAWFTEENLKKYAAVVFLSTNGEVLNAGQECDFERFIQAGGGYVGIHASSATEYTWHWYGQLVGGYFKDHPAIQETPLQVADCNHPATRHLCGQDWTWKDEWYNFRNFEPDLHTLVTIDESAYKGGSSPGLTAPNTRHPLAWCHEFDGGRAFYTALGHRTEAFSDPAFLQHLLGGIQYAIGDNATKKYDRCHTQRTPDQTRFVKTVVAHDLDEPMEIALLPTGKIIMVQRHGQIKLFDPKTNLLNIVVKLPVYSEMGDGLMGVAVDPAWEQNHWIYLYYSSLQDSMNQLSRFVFRGDTLDRASETVLLTVPTGHKDCFHAAGSLTFDGEGNLFLSTGDNTSPFASDGFAPIDERPGRKSFDAQRSSGNTMDLRGKILRIKPQADGSYICPAGNLFTQKNITVAPRASRPEPWRNGSVSRQWNQENPSNPLTGAAEVYVMGCRNPFRIAFDARRKLLFWGDVGPDAGKGDTLHGALGHDEINRAREAGNYGWPYFVADNQPYRRFDFDKKQPGPWFDPVHPKNESPNNTGARELPPAQPAFIWYPYGKNRDFPLLGSGGRNAMAGPTYYCDEYPEATRFPDYYNGKVLIYDWMRSWIMAVTLDSAGNFYRLERMADSVQLSRPMDMLIDRDGVVWMLEYGTRWYSSNPDARLTRLDYVRGNRPPVARLRATPVADAAPMDVEFEVGASQDYDGGHLTYEIDYGDGITEKINTGCRKMPAGWNPDTATVKGSWKIAETRVRHRYTRAGIFKAVLKVKDALGATGTAEKKISVGNAPPAVTWSLGGHNLSFYNPGESVAYSLQVEDREDGRLNNGIPADQVSISLLYEDKILDPEAVFAQKEAGAGADDKFVRGKTLVDNSDCKSCHAIDHQVNGPSFQAVAERYRKGEFGVPGIYRKIIYGGRGNWGTGEMIAHPQIKEEDAIQMALWILSLADPPKPVQTIPPSGALTLEPEKKDGKPPVSPGTFVVKAAYRDRAQGEIPALARNHVLALRPALLQAESCNARSEGVNNYKPYDNDTVVLHELRHNTWFMWRGVDMSGLKGIQLRIGSGDKKMACIGGRLELHLDRREGPLVASVDIPEAKAERMTFSTFEVALPTTADHTLRKLYFVWKNETNTGGGVCAVDWVKFLLQ